MSPLRVPRRLTSDRLDALASEVGRGAGVLHLTEKLSAVDPLAIPLAIQAVISWSRYNQGGILRVGLDFSDLAAVAKSLQLNTVLLVGILMAERVENESGMDVTADATRAARLAHAASETIPLRGSGVTVGSDRAVIAIDHLSGLEYPGGLYARTKDARTGEVVHMLDSSAQAHYARAEVDELVPQSWPLGWRALSMSRIALTHDARFRHEAYELGQALFELMQNTHDHARVDDAGYALRSSVRGIHVRSSTQLRGELVDAVGGHPELANFFARLPASAEGGPLSNLDRLRTVAVTVFDSGPGIAAKMLRDMGFRHDFTPEDELRATLRALKKTETAARPGMRGAGLMRVQRYLTEAGGFAMVRCGHFQLTRDFIHRKYPPFGTSDRATDWYGGLAEPTHQTRTHGSAFTMIVPSYGS